MINKVQITGMNTFREIVCPICKGNHFDYFATCTDYFTSQEKFDIVRCPNCGLLITKNFPNSTEIGRYYQSENYISHTNTSKGFINSIYHRVRSYMLNKKYKLVCKTTKIKKGNILDYGAGIGLFVNKMNEKGWRAIGLEKSEQARSNAQKWFDITLYTSSEWDLIPNGSQRAITLWHVMEHVEELDELWKNISDKLDKETGKLIVALPNSASYDAKYFKGNWAAYDVPRHLWHFDKNSFKKLAEKHGFQIEAIKRMPFDGFYISMMSEKNQHKSFPIICGFGIALWGYLKSLINKTNSSSLIYILRRREE